MKVYTFIIGSMDDFESLDALIDYVEVNSDKGFQNYSCFEFDCPADCSEELVISMGRGYAFSNDWCMDGTFSFLIKGTVGESLGTDGSQMKMHDLWELPNGGK
jgi:hypothetical protein